MLPIKVLQQAGSAPIIDTQTMVAGLLGTAPNRVWGYQTAVFGSLTDGTCNFYGGAAYVALKQFEDNGSGVQISLVIAGVQADSGWTSMTWNGVTLTRAAGGYSNNGINSFWGWLVQAVNNTGTYTIVFK